MRLSSLKKNPHNVSCKERKRNKADSKLAHISSALFFSHFLIIKTVNFCTKEKKNAEVQQDHLFILVHE